MMSNAKDHGLANGPMSYLRADGHDPAAEVAPMHVYVVDDDDDVRETLRTILLAEEYRVTCFSRPGALLAEDLKAASCILIDISMPEMNGLLLQSEILRRGCVVPVIFITGVGDVPAAVQAMQAGAFDFIEKPFDAEQIASSVRAAVEIDRRARGRARNIASAQAVLALLTPRELTVFHKLVQGNANKIVAYELGISPRTVEVHRAQIMRKLKARSVADLVRISATALRNDPSATESASDKTD